MALVTIVYTNKAIFGGFNSESVQYLIEIEKKKILFTEWYVLQANNIDSYTKVLVAMTRKKKGLS